MAGLDDETGHRLQNWLCRACKQPSVLKTGQFGVHLELPLSLQALISNVHEAALVGEDCKFAMLEI